MGLSDKTAVTDLSAEDVFRDRLSEGLRRKAMNQRGLARAIGVEESQVSRWTRDSVPRTITLQKIAAALGVTVEWLLGGDAAVLVRPAHPAKKQDWHELLKVAFAAAGEPIHSIPSDATWYAFHASWVERQAKGATKDEQRLVVVEVDRKEGESMTPTIRPSAIVVVDRGPGCRGVLREEYDRRKSAIYLVNPVPEAEKPAITIKRVSVVESGHELVLMSDNRSQPPQIVTMKGRTFQSVVVGRILWVGQEPGEL